MKLTKIEQVEKLVGRPPGPRDLKVIDHLDEHAQRWLSHARFAGVAFGSGAGIQLTLAGGQPGFTVAPDAKTLSLPLAALDDAAACEAQCSFGALFIVSGMEETLRVNGRVTQVEDGRATLAVDECYLHCAKSFRRSGFWEAASEGASGRSPEAFLKDARFLMLATMNASGQVDVSPKGDPAGLLIQQHDGAVCFADRPGNRRIDGFRNIIEQPGVCLIAVIPGHSDIVAVDGTADLLADKGLAQQFAVQGKAPKLVTRVVTGAMRPGDSAAIAMAGLWPAGTTPDDLVPSEIFKAHVKKSKENSLQAKVARAAVSVPGAMEAGLERDYKKNMY